MPFKSAYSDYRMGEALVKYRFNVETYSGIIKAEYDTEKLGPLEKKLLENMDPRAKELVYLFLREGFFEEKEITTEGKLLKYEAYRNSVDGEIISECSGIGEKGIVVNKEQVQEIYSYIWRSYLFVESTDMDFPALSFYRKLRDNVEDADQLLFWSFRLCVWGGYDNRLPYTLYKGLLDGRFAKYYDDFPEERKLFVFREE